MVSVLPKIPKNPSPCLGCGAPCIPLYCEDCVTLRAASHDAEGASIDWRQSSATLGSSISYIRRLGFNPGFANSER